MRYLTETKKTPVINGYDVVVVGGGPAGIAAAIASARNNAKTLLIEQTGALGGMSTTGLMPCFASFGKHGEVSIKGIGREVVENLKKAHACTELDDGVFKWVYKDSEKLKVIYDDMVRACGVDVRFFTFFAGVIKKRKRITHVIIENKSGRQAVSARIIVDASGDADVAAAAGVPFAKGDANGTMQPASLCMTVVGIDQRRCLEYVGRIGNLEKVRRWWQEQINKGELVGFKDAEYRGLGFSEVFPGGIGFNFGHIYSVDGTKAEDLTKIMMIGRKMASSFVEFGRRKIPGMQNATLVATATLPGIRETRRIQGKYEMSADDYFAARHFDDEIAEFDNTIDLHNATKKNRDFAKFNKDYDSLVLPKGKTYGIRFASLLPLGIDNLVVAGRSIASDRMINASLRVMPCCFATGQAAGTAAAIAVQTKIGVAKIDVQSLRQRLRKQGAHLS